MEKLYFFYFLRHKQADMILTSTKSIRTKEMPPEIQLVDRATTRIFGTIYEICANVKDACGV